MPAPEPPPLPLLFLIGDTGGGHRSAAAAVAQSLDRLLPGRFAPVIADPLRGPGTPGLLRWIAGLYGPCIRLTPWLWWLFWRTCDSPRGLRVLRRTVMHPVYGGVARAVAACRPALIVAFHPVTAEPAVRARDQASPLSPVITVVTDLVTAHRAWRDAAADQVIVPSREMAARYAGDEADPGRYLPLGLPVAADFCQPPLSAPERANLKRELGVKGISWSCSPAARRDQAACAAGPPSSCAGWTMGKRGPADRARLRRQHGGATRADVVRAWSGAGQRPVRHRRRSGRLRTASPAARGRDRAAAPRPQALAAMRAASAAVSMPFAAADIARLIAGRSGLLTPPPAMTCCPR
jgi:hypothetical protein